MAKRKGISRGPRRKFAKAVMGEWKPLKNAISQKQYDDEYLKLIAQLAGVANPAP